MDLIFTFLSSVSENIDTDSGRRLGMNQELRYNLATKVMRNGVEVIVATDRNLRPVEPEYLRHLSSTVTRPITLAPHTLTNLMSMVLPTDHSDDSANHLMSLLKPYFITRTYYTTYNYPATVLQANTTTVSNFSTTVTNVKTEIYSRTKLSEANIQPTATQDATLEVSPTLQTEIYHTAYTYWNTLLDGDQPIVMTSTYTLSNTLVGAFDNYLEPSEVFPMTNTYLKTVEFTKTLTDGTDFQIISTKDLVTQVVVTDKSVKKATNIPITTDVTKTYFVTYTYFSTYIDGDQTKVKSDVSVSSDVTIEKFYIKPKKTETKIMEQTNIVKLPVKPSGAAFPFNILATKTYLTTFSYYTTLLQGSNSDKAETKINSRTKVVENTVTQTMSLQDFNADYLIRLNSSLNKVSGSLIATATLKGGEKIRVTVHKYPNFSSSYLKYEIKPTTLIAETKSETYQTEKEETLTKLKSTYSKPSALVSKTKSPLLHKSKIKPTKTSIREATAEAFIAMEAETKVTSVTSTVTLTPVSASFATENLATDDVVTHSAGLLRTSSLPPEEVTELSNEQNANDQLEQSSGISETEASKKKPGLKQPALPMNVSNLLNLNSLGINGMNVLGPVFNAMAELIHNNLNKNVDTISRRNDTVAPVKEIEQVSKKPASNNYNPLLNFVNKFTPATAKGTSEPKVKATTPRTPVYIPVGSFANDSEFGESQDSEVVANKPDNWHDKWTDTHAKNFEKGRPHDPPITILEGGIPISPGQVITTNSDVIIGRPGETGPRPPKFAVKNNIPIDMKPPPLPPHVLFNVEEEDGFVGQHSTNQGVDFNVNQEHNIKPSRPPVMPLKKHPQEPHKNLRPHPNDRYKGFSHHKNLHTGKHTHSDYNSGTMDLNPPPVPPPPVRSHDVHRPITINHEQKDESYKTPHHILSIPLHLGPNQNVENYINPAEISPAALGLPALPALGQLNQENIHQILSEPTPSINTNLSGILLIPTVGNVPLNLIKTENSNLVDRSNGHQLLVNIQPSQVANIVIPHGSSTALILSDGKQHSLKGEVIDDPSPHPEPETVGFVGAEPVLKIESDDISASIHNDVVPAEAVKITHQSSQESHAILSNRPHLTTELIKIRPKPGFNDAQEQHPYLFYSGSEPNLPTAFFGPQETDHLPLLSSQSSHAENPLGSQDFSYIKSHRQTENHKNSQSQNLHLGEQNLLKTPNKILTNQNQDIQALNFANKANKIFISQNFRKEGPNTNNAATNSIHHIKEVANSGHLMENQHKHLNYLANAGGLRADQIKFNQGPNPIRGGNGIYVDISPPGHLPPRPNLLHQSHSSNKQPTTLNEHLLNHQSGLVHDVPLNAQVQLGSVQKKENPLKEILISANTNKYDSIHDPKKKPLESQNNSKRPLSDLAENLSPPPINKEENYRIHRPLPFKPPHPMTSAQRYPHQPLPKPIDFIMSPPQIPHRPIPKPLQPQTNHQRPVIPIGAGAPQQNYPNPRPEDILIVPHKNRPGSSLNYISNINHETRLQSLGSSNRDVSDNSDSLKSEYGEEIQESISRPLFPGQLPPELQKLNSTHDNHLYNHKNKNSSKNKLNLEINQGSKLKGNTSTTYIRPTPESEKENIKDLNNASFQWSVDYNKQNLPHGIIKAHEQTPALTPSGHGSFFSLIKKPSGFVTTNNTEVVFNASHKETMFTNHKESTNSANHKEQSSFDSHRIISSVKNPSSIGAAGGGKIRIHAVGPSVVPSGFIKNENTVITKRPSAPSTANTTKVSDLSSHELSIPSILSITNNKIHNNVYDKESNGASMNNVASTSDSSIAFGLKTKPTKLATNNRESNQHKKDKTTHPSGSTYGQDKQSDRHESLYNYSPKDEASTSYQKFNSPGVLGQKDKRLPVQESEDSSETIKFDREKISNTYPSVTNSETEMSGNSGSGKPHRYPTSDLVSGHSIKTNKRPSEFTSKKEDNKISESVALEDVTAVPENKTPPKHPNGPKRVPSGFASKNETNSYAATSNHNYVNKTVHIYKPKLTPDNSEELEVTYNKANLQENDVDKWFASNFRGGNGNAELNKETHRNMSSLPNMVLPADPDIQITLLTPPKVNDVRPKPEDVMGLSPPPLERPRRPQTQRPKPPFKFELPTTPKSTVLPIAVENDFPPVRTPEFNRKPLKPQDIFPPRLPDNFIHHIPEFPIRNHPKPRPITSMPIDTKGDSSTENIYSVDKEENDGKEIYFSGSEINGHSKPIVDDEPNLSSMRPPPPPPLRPNNSKVKQHLKPSTIHQQPPKIRTSERIQPETPSSKQKLPVSTEREEISPTPTLSPPVKTTFHTKISTSVTPTVVESQKDWLYADIITGSETIFDPEKFSSYLTPTINDFINKKNIVTTLISTGSTTIFGNLYTPGLKKISESTSKSSTSSTVNQKENIKDKATETTLVPARTTLPVHTLTLTVTTTMTTVVHSIGHKPLTKTIVLTKTLISTVVNKITETKTLVKPTTATVIQTHTVATTKTALVVPTALYPTQTKYPAGGTLKPEIFVADPHAKDTMTVSVSSSMNKNKHEKDTLNLGGAIPNQSGEDSILVFMTDKHPDINLSTDEDNNIDVISDEDNDLNEQRVVVGGVFDANGEGEKYTGKSKEMECTPGCKAQRNELCQRIESVMKCVCRPGFARMFPDRPCRPTYTYNVWLALEKFGSERLSHEKNFVPSTSPNMAKLASATKEGLDRMIMQSDLRDVYHGMMLNGFQEKDRKTMVDFYVQLSENTDENKLMEILKKTLQSSNYSLGGTELFAARESGGLYAEDFNECLNPKFHDCSENARCFNLKGTYTCSCKEGFTDLSENSQFPGRVCSDTIGCEYCGYHGACYSKGEGQITCECFQWYSGERCHINLKVLLIALVTIGAVLLALLLVCAVMACLNKKSRSSTASRTNGSSAGYLRYRGPSSQSLDRRAMIGDSSSESSVENLPYVCSPSLPLPEAMTAKKKSVLRHTKGQAPRPVPPMGLEQRDRSVTVMIPRAKYRPMPPLSPHLTMSTFSPDKHLSKTAAQIATEQKLISYLDGNSREERTLGNSVQNNRQAKEQQKNSEYKILSATTGGSPKPTEKKKDSKVFEYEYKISNMLFTEETNSTDKRSFKSLDDRFRRHSDSTHLNSDSNKNQFRKYSAGALVSAGYEVSARVGMHHLEEDTTEDEHSAIINTQTMKSNRSQFTTLNRVGDHKTMSEARSYDETTVHPSTRSLKTHYSGSSPSSRVNNDEGHTMIERDLGSTFIMPESQLFKPEADRGSDISNFDSL